MLTISIHYQMFILWLTTQWPLHSLGILASAAFTLLTNLIRAYAEHSMANKLRVRQSFVCKGVPQQQDAVNFGLYMVKALDLVAKDHKLLLSRDMWFMVCFILTVSSSR